VLRAAATGTWDVRIVLPRSAGARRRAPTPTGKVVVDFLTARGRRSCDTARSSPTSTTGARSHGRPTSAAVAARSTSWAGGKLSDAGFSSWSPATPACRCRGLRSRAGWRHRGRCLRLIEGGCSGGKHRVPSRAARCPQQEGSKRPGRPRAEIGHTRGRAEATRNRRGSRPRLRVRPIGGAAIAGRVNGQDHQRRPLVMCPVVEAPRRGYDVVVVGWRVGRLATAARRPPGRGASSSFEREPRIARATRRKTIQRITRSLNTRRAGEARVAGAGCAEGGALCREHDRPTW